MKSVHDKIITFRVTSEEKEHLVKYARAANTSVSDFLRVCALDSSSYDKHFKNSRDDRVAKEINKLYLELRHQGNNFNQIAYRLNRRKHMASEEEREEAIRAIADYAESYRDFVNRLIGILR